MRLVILLPTCGQAVPLVYQASPAIIFTLARAEERVPRYRSLSRAVECESNDDGRNEEEDSGRPPTQQACDWQTHAEAVG